MHTGFQPQEAVAALRAVEVSQRSVRVNVGSQRTSWNGNVKGKDHIFLSNRSAWRVTGKVPRLKDLLFSESF